MKKQEKACKYMEGVALGEPSSTYSRCKITNQECSLVCYKTQFGVKALPGKEDWERCPAYNIEDGLASKLRLSALEQKKSEIELKEEVK